MPGAGSLQRADQPVQLGGARGGPHTPDEPHRETRNAAAQHTQRQHAGWIGPLQVIQTDHQRPGQRQLLRQVGESVYCTEPQARVACHGDRALVPGVRDGQQPGDGRPARVRR